MVLCKFQPTDPRIMDTTEKDPDQLEDLTDDQLEAMIRLIRSGKLGFEVHRTNPGQWSYDLGISVDHDEFIEAIETEEDDKFTVAHGQLMDNMAAEMGAENAERTGGTPGPVNG